MSDKTVKINVYSDPGHGWGAVKIKLLKEINFPMDKITVYSHVKGQTVYLEEDLDLSNVINALRDHGYTVNYNEKYTDYRSPIRNYMSYSPSLVI